MRDYVMFTVIFCISGEQFYLWFLYTAKSGGVVQFHGERQCSVPQCYLSKFFARYRTAVDHC